jgi:hypothetical protein
MKKGFWMSLFFLTVLFVCTSCATTRLTTNKVGWSDYTGITIKDFDVVGIITVESEVTKKVAPFGLNSSLEGSEITYAMLMEEAAKKKGDDIINVRIDKIEDSTKSLFDFIVGYKKTTKYIATALAIKYKDVKTGSPSGFKQELNDASENSSTIPFLSSIPGLSSFIN